MVDALGLKIGAIFLFFAVSLSGAFSTIYAPPWVLEGATLPVLCALAAGIMMGVAMAHLIPEGDDLLSDAIPQYRLCFALVGLGVTAVLGIEQITIALIAKGHNKKKRNQHMSHDSRISREPPSFLLNQDDEDADLKQPIFFKEEADLLHGDEHHGHGMNSSDRSSHDHHMQRADRQSRNSVASHCHGAEMLADLSQAHSLKDFVSLYALELSVSVHSIILGVDYGLERKSSTLIALTIALAFHQCIEGIALGAAVANLRSMLSEKKVITFMVFFASTISMGVIIGIISSFQGESSATKTVQGVFSGLAAGSLLYVSLAEQVSSYFNRPDLEDQLGTKVMMVLAFLSGFGAMAALAAWE
eukprot:gene1891-2068_t